VTRVAKYCELTATPAHNRGKAQMEMNETRQNCEQEADGQITKEAE